VTLHAWLLYGGVFQELEKNRTLQE